MVYKWSSVDFVKFLDVYEESEGLWNIRQSNYNNKIKRDIAMLKLMGELLKRMCGCWKCEGSTKEDKKYKNVYRQELRELENKKKNKKKSGAGTDYVYQPTLAWFKRADIFLKNVVSSRTTSNLLSTFVLLHNFSYFYYINL